MKFKLITAQTDWAVTLADVKAHLRVDSTDDEDYIQNLIYAAQAQISEDYDLSLNAETWEAYLDKFPNGTIELDFWPVASITSVKYTDEDETEQTVSTSYYSTDVTGKPARIVPNSGYTWPETHDSTANAVQIRFTTGFTSPAVIPADIKQAMYLIIADWYDNRHDSRREFPQASHRILKKYQYK